MKQLLLFEETHENKCDRKVQELTDKQERVRKKLFAENSYLRKRLDDLERKYEILEANLCKGKLL